MLSLRELYRIGLGPSSSHTMGPALAAMQFRARYPTAVRFHIDLLGSLAATVRGHGTDRAVIQACAPFPVDIAWLPEERPAFHPNGLELRAYAETGHELGRWRVFSVGGGALREAGEPVPPGVYPAQTMADLLTWAAHHHLPLWRYVFAYDDPAIADHLATCWHTMRRTLARGLEAEGELPGGLRLKRRAHAMIARSRGVRAVTVAAFALAVMEENAAGNEVVTAPTCGACGVVPMPYENRPSHQAYKTESKDIPYGENFDLNPHTSFQMPPTDPLTPLLSDNMDPVPTRAKAELPAVSCNPLPIKLDFVWTYEFLLVSAWNPNVIFSALDNLNVINFCGADQIWQWYGAPGSGSKGLPALSWTFAFIGGHQPYLPGF